MGIKKNEYLCRKDYLHYIIIKTNENMTTSIPLPQNVNMSSPLGALIAHFNSSS